MNFYTELINSLELIKQYILVNGGIYSLSNGISIDNDVFNAKNIFNKLVAIKRTANSLYELSSSREHLSLEKSIISDFISIKYSSDYINIASSLDTNKSSNTLKLVSNK